MRNYSVIVFDLGNVLLPFGYTSALKKLNAIDKELGDKFWEYYRNNYKLHRDFERGDIPGEEFIDLMLRVLENKVDKKTFCDLYSRIFTEDTEVTGLLPGLKERYTLILLSNTNSIHMEYGWKDFPFLKYFDKLILSHQVYAVKPEEKIYRAVEKYTGKPPEEHIFIDDIEEYVNAAKKAGWDGIVFTNGKELLLQLQSKGIVI